MRTDRSERSRAPSCIPPLRTIRQNAATSAAVENKPLVDLLAADKEISKHVGRKELEQMCDPANYLGLAGEMVDRVLAIEAASR